MKYNRKFRNPEEAVINEPTFSNTIEYQGHPYNKFFTPPQMLLTMSKILLKCMGLPKKKKKSHAQTLILHSNALMDEIT